MTRYTREDYEKIEKLRANIGGYFTGLYSVELDIKERTVKWFHFSEEHTTIKTEEEIEQIIYRLSEIGVLDWKENYYNMMILDGTQWSLEVDIGGEKIEKGGSNRYPKKWNAFCKLMSDISERCF